MVVDNWCVKLMYDAAKEVLGFKVTASLRCSFRHALKSGFCSHFWHSLPACTEQDLFQYLHLRCSTSQCFVGVQALDK